MEIFCVVCGSYVHEFLHQCPACGAPKPSDLEAELRESPRPLYDGPTLDPAWIDYRTQTQADIASMAAIADDSARKMTYRYLGGLPGFVGTVDVELRVQPDLLVLANARSGQPMAACHGHQILAIIAMPRDSQLDYWFGVFASPVGALFTPTIHGGALTVVYVQLGAVYSFTLGDRTGLLASHGTPEYYTALAAHLGGWAAPSAQERVAEVGAPAYARELGLPDELVSMQEEPEEDPYSEEASEEGGDDGGFDWAPYQGPYEFVPERGQASEVLAGIASGPRPWNLLILGPSSRGEDLAFWLARRAQARYVRFDLGATTRLADLVVMASNLGSGDLLFLPDLDDIPEHAVEALATMVQRRDVDVVVGGHDEGRSLHLTLQDFKMVVWSVSGSIPRGLGPWNAQLLFGSEADQLWRNLRPR